MAQTVGEIMGDVPLSMSPDTTVMDAARQMKDNGIGDILITEEDRVKGMVTDRDIIVRCLAEGREPRTTSLLDICTRNIVTATPNDEIDHVVDLMRRNAVRRVPVLDREEPVGIVSIGDLALERDPRSALADISAAAPNT